MKKPIIAGSIIIVGAFILLLIVAEKKSDKIPATIIQSQNNNEKKLAEHLTSEQYKKLESYSKEIENYYVAMLEGKHGFTSVEEKVIQKNKEDVEALKYYIVEGDTDSIKNSYATIEQNYFNLYCMPQIEILENPYNLPRGKSEKSQYIIWKSMKENSKAKDENKKEELEKGIEKIKELNESNDERFHHLIEGLNIQVLAEKDKGEYKIRAAGFDTVYDNLDTLLLDLKGIF